MTGAPLAQAPARHQVPVRHVTVPYDETIPTHWFAGNPVLTHFFNGLNLLFPEGERFFIDSVREHLPAVRDPELVRQARGFFGQEGRHAHEHERYFEVLRSQGYEIDRFLTRFSGFVHRIARWTPASLRLSVTAAAEHYTATFAEMALDDERLARDVHPAMLQLIWWHAAEEVEHRNVAFDVLQATRPSYLLRIAGFLFASLDLWFWTWSGSRMLMRQDGLTRAQRRAARREARIRDGGHTGQRLLQMIRAYLQRDFHPDQFGDLDRARGRLAEIGIETPTRATPD